MHAYRHTPEGGEGSVTTSVESTSSALLITCTSAIIKYEVLGLSPEIRNEDES